VTTHWSSNAENWTDLTGHGVSLSGYEGLDEDWEYWSPYQGTYSWCWGVAATAGWARGYKDIAGALPVGSTFHVGFAFMTVRDKDDLPSSYDPAVPSGSVNLLSCTNATSSKGLLLQMTSVNGASHGKKLRVATNVVSGSGDSSDGVEKETWNLIDLYYYMHNTAGYGQLFVNGTRWAQFSGVDTYDGDIGRIKLGPSYKDNEASRLTTWFDAVVWDDEASPLPPGQRARGKVSSSLAGGCSRGGLVSGPQALRQYREIERRRRAA